MSVFNHELLSAADEEFHLGDDPAQMDSSWYGFYIPEKEIYVWAYHLVFHNLGVCSGGVFAWDGEHENLPDMNYYGKVPLAKLARGSDRKNYTFPTGMHLEVIEPLNKHHVCYKDGNLIEFDVTYEGVLPPYVCVNPETGQPFHIDHLSRVTGKLILHGEEYDVNCLCNYDHGWGTRDPVKPTPVGDWQSMPPEKLGDKPATYCFGAASERDNFFLLDLQFWIDGPMPHFGYFTKDGVSYEIEKAKQELDRRPDGKLQGVTFLLTAPDGTEFRASGRAVSHVLSPNAGNIDFAELCLAKFDIEGKPGWGDLQDSWPPAAWRAFRKGLGAV